MGVKLPLQEESLATFSPTSFPGSSPSRPLEREKEGPWNTLVTCLPQTLRDDKTQHRVRGWQVRINGENLQPHPVCYVLSSPRFGETREQRFPGALSLSL